MEDGSNVAPNMVAPVQTEKPKKSKKGLVIGLICGGVVVIGAVVAVLLLVLGGVSKADYRSAQELAQRTANYISKTDSVISEIMSTSTPTRETLEEATAQIREFKSQLDSGLQKLGEERAIRNDAKAREKYDALMEAFGEYSDNINLLIEIYEQPMYVFLRMMQLSEFSSIESDEEFNAMVAEFREIAADAKAVNTGSAVINEAMSDIGDSISAMADALDAAFAGDENALDDVNSANSDLQDAGQKFTDEVTRLADSGNAFASKLNSLGEYLTEKANK